MNEKDKFQEEVSNLSKIHPLLVVQSATGTGKGKAVLMSIILDTSNKQWLILVPEILQIENLKEEIIKQGFEYLLQHKIKDIICYASFKQYTGTKYNLWLNEAHRLSELKEDIASTVKFDRIIADSATIPYNVKNRLNSLGKFYYYELSLQEAIDRKILPEPIIYKIPVELDNKIKRNSKQYGKIVSLLTDKSFAEVLDKDLEYWKKRYSENPNDKWITGILNKTGGKRKNFFTSKKTECLKNLLKTLENKRLVCFTGSLEQCDLIGENNAIHSKKTKKHNLETFKKFNNKEINSIFLNKMGREGLNLVDIEVGIMVQLGTGNDEGLEFLQILGRSIRAIKPEFYIFYCKNTKDEDFLQKALKHINPKYIKEWKTIN